MTTSPVQRVLNQVLDRQGTIPLVYHDLYNIGFANIEKLHPFDSKKYGRVLDILSKQSIKQLSGQSITITDKDLFKPKMPSIDLLRTIHTEAYLKSLESSSKVASIVEVSAVSMLPSSIVRKHVLEPMMLATSGTIVAGMIAADRAIAFKSQSMSVSLSTQPSLCAINLAGGYHHASSAQGSGFCVYSDIPLMIRHVHEAYPDKMKKFLIVDLDAHQGNGHEKDKRDGVLPSSISVHIYDQYNSGIFPCDTYAREAIDTDAGLQSGTNDEQYMSLLREKLPSVMTSFQPDMVIYNAGTDCLEGDPLGDLSVTADGIIMRDEYVFQTCRDNNCPLVMVLSGGYQKINASIIAQSIINLHDKFGVLNRLH